MEVDLQEEVTPEAEEVDLEVVWSELVRAHTQLHSLGREDNKSEAEQPMNIGRRRSRRKCLTTTTRLTLTFSQE